MEIEDQRAENINHSDPLFKQNLHRNMSQQLFKNPMMPESSTGNMDRWVLALESVGITDPSRRLLQQRRIKHQKRLKAALKHNKQHYYAAAPEKVFDGAPDVITIDDEGEDVMTIDDEDGKLWSSSDEDLASISDHSDLTDELGIFLYTRGITEDVKKYSRDEVFQLSSVEEVCSMLGLGR